VGTLYVVATPIGNLEDVSLRALRVLREVSLIAAEDTRHTRVLLQRYDIKTRLTSYFEHNKLSKLQSVVAALDRGDVALVSDAGTPGLSDPGYELIRASLDAGHDVQPVPGPSAALAALVVSGLPTDQFVYVGFLPRRPTDRRRLLSELSVEPRTIVGFEAPHRLVSALEDVSAELGDRPLAVCQELTKLYERVFRGTAGSALDHFTAHAPRGEYTMVIGGATRERAPASEEDTDAMLRRLLAEGESTRDAVTIAAAELGVDRRILYRRAKQLLQSDKTRDNM
jgi:16S rRNA (cytidine1402-2'-O)-methyltransferase